MTRFTVAQRRPKGLPRHYVVLRGKVQQRWRWMSHFKYRVDAETAAFWGNKGLRADAKARLLAKQATA